MKPTIDRSSSPVFVVRWPADIDSDELREHFREVAEIAAGRRAAFVIDMRERSVPAASLRRIAAEELRNVFAVHGERITGVAHVVESALVRGVMTAVYWLAPPPFPTVMTGTLDEAMEWARGRLEV